MTDVEKAFASAKASLIAAEIQYAHAQYPELLNYPRIKAREAFGLTSDPAQLTTSQRQAAWRAQRELRRLGYFRTGRG